MYLRVLRQNVMVHHIIWKVVGVSRSALRNCKSVQIVRKSSPNPKLKEIGLKIWYSVWIQNFFKFDRDLGLKNFGIRI